MLYERLFRTIVKLLFRTGGENTSVGIVRAGPPLIQFARNLVEERSDVALDDLETEFLVCSNTVLIRAWLVLPYSAIPSEVLDATIRTADRLADPQRLVRAVLYLSVGYGLPIDAIARKLGISPRKTRRLLLRAIRLLDRRD